MFDSFSYNVNTTAHAVLCSFSMPITSLRQTPGANYRKLTANTCMLSPGPFMRRLRSNIFRLFIICFQKKENSMQ